MNRRKDSENFPTLDHKPTENDVIDPTKEIEFKEKPTKEKSTKEKPTKEKSNNDKKIEDKKEVKIPEPVIISNFRQVSEVFEKLMNEIKPGESLVKVKSLPIVDLGLTPTVEELYPTKPREIFRGSRNRKKKQNKGKKGGNQSEMISLTKGRYGK